MALYSVKKSRGRKIKKYRKSRRGKGRGKINLKCGKTRRYKVFKNHTLGKRKGRGRGRQMIGGSIDWIENNDHYNNLMKVYINAKYKDKIIADLGNNDTTLSGFSKVQQMCNKVVMITNKSKGWFLREENQIQRLLIYSCHMNRGQSAPMRGGGQGDTIVCYALVRVPHLLYKNKGNGPPIVGMNDKILFIRPGLSSVTNIDMNIGLTKQEQYEILETYKKYLLQNQKKLDKTRLEKIKNTTYKIIIDSFRCYEFKSFISSGGDKYRIFMIVDMNIPIHMQCSLFDTLSNTQEQPQENSPEQHEEPQENSQENPPDPPDPPDPPEQHDE